MYVKSLFVAFLAAASSAQSPAPNPPADSPQFTLRQDVRNVVVDVVATDKHGDPIRSLDKSRFQIFENGVAQDVVFFEEHTAAEQAAAPVAKPQLPAGVHTNISAVPAGGSLMVLLLDALNTRSSNQSYVRGQVLEYLKEIPADTSMAIFALADDLKMIQGFTSDRAVLKAALDGKAYPTPILNSIDGPIGAGSGDRSNGGMIAFSHSVASIRSSLDRFGNGPQDFADEMRIRYTLDAFNALGVYLSRIQGRKNLVWFTGSVPWTVNPDFSLVTDPTGRVDWNKELKKLADVLTVGRIAVYPVDANALGTPGGYGPDHASPSFGMRSNGGAFGRAEMNAQMNIAGSHMSMSNLANATGGIALYNTNGLAGAVAKVHSIGQNYYTIVYSPRDKRYDGRFRKIEVKTGDAGMKLEYRRGYYAQDPAEASKRPLNASSNVLHSVMLRGAPDATQIPFRVQTELSARQPDPARPDDRVGQNAAALKCPLTRYEFHWNVDLSSVVFTTTPDGRHHGEIDATVYAYSADGQILNNIYSVLPLNLDDALYALVIKSGLPMKQSLDVPAGLLYMRAGVLDPNSGHTGATEFPMAVMAGANGPGDSHGAH